ncbi:MAG: molybdopterin-guanine dinucleotide biosynthesis protein B [Chlorobi bacterium]|nr:molybdopterin-guanine dinucleotide biosynthesis protein B [Chlorobiota bacterium]
MRKINNMILVSGSGRNSGKTTLCCALIEALSETGEVTAIKIAPHFHLTGKQQELTEQGPGYRIFVEKDTGTDKDTSRMLRAGAQTVYFVQCADRGVEHAVRSLKRLLHDDRAIVCESGSLGLFFEPSYHVLVERPEPDMKKESYLLNKHRADLIVGTGQIGIQLARKIIRSGKINIQEKQYYDKDRRSA